MRHTDRQRNPVFGVGSARWPDGPPKSGVAHGFTLIPVSDVGGAVDENKTGGKAENSGTPGVTWCADGMILRETHRIAQTS